MLQRFLLQLLRACCKQANIKRLFLIYYAFFITSVSTWSKFPTHRSGLTPLSFPQCFVTALFGETFLLGKRESFGRPKGNVFFFSSRGDEIILFAQLEVVMDGLCEEDMLGMREVICNREDKAV